MYRRLILLSLISFLIIFISSFLPNNLSPAYAQYYDGMTCVAGCSNPFDLSRCTSQGYDSCSTIYGGDGSQSFCCNYSQPTPTPTPTPTATPTPVPPTPAPTPTYAISGNVWVDKNRNGAVDAGEGPYFNATVSLSGTATDSTTTNASGIYSFFSLSTGNYTVTLTVPFGYEATTTNPVSGISVPPNMTANFGIALLTSCNYSATPDGCENETRWCGASGNTICSTCSSGFLNCDRTGGCEFQGASCPAATPTPAPTAIPAP